MEKLGKYVILGELGRGAGGVVYRARDPIINRLVALKTITTGLAEFPDLLQRFYQEAQSAGGLQHPNIVTIYDMGDERGVPYIAMELLEGESLDQLIARRTPLPVPLKLTYALQACRALDYAHKRGIIHRDVKPDNVMLTRDGTVKVVDFGIARVLETSKTQTGMLLGTFAYMSPEQYHGEHADARSDIWSFGVLLYELLAYQRPFKGQTPASLMHSICQQEPQSLLEVAPECPPALEKVVHKVLRKSAEERYQSMEELALDLDPICKSLQAESVISLVAQARELSGKGDYSQSLIYLRQALQIDSTNTPARNLLEKVNTEQRRILLRPKLQQQVEKGHVLLAEGKIQEARAEAEIVLQLDASFEPAQALLKQIEGEINRARQVAEWIESAKQRLAQGLLEEAEEVLAKIQEIESDNHESKTLQIQLSIEKAERRRRLHLSGKMQQARSLWTQQNYGECLELLAELQKEFPDEEEIPRLLETAREDQASELRSQGLADVRSMLANRRFEECKVLLAELQKQFPGDEEILKLQRKTIEEQRKEQRLQSFAEARSLLAARRYDVCTSLLNSLQTQFPDDEELLQLQKNVIDDQRKQRRSQSVVEARSLFAARRYDDCTFLLNSLLNEFPGDDEILQLQGNVLDDQRKQQMLESLNEARNLLAAKRYDDSIARLTALQKEFPEEADISRLLEAAREDGAEQQRQQGVATARKLLAGRQHQECNVLLLELQKQFPADDEIPKLLALVRKDQAEQRKLQSLAEARSLLSSRKYEDCIALLAKLQSEHPDERDINKLLQTAREDQAEQRKLQSLAEARSLLGSRRYEECIALLAKLQNEHPNDKDITKSLQAAREDQAEQHKLKSLTEARNLLAARQYEKCLLLLANLQREYPKDNDVAKLLETAREDRTEEQKQRQLADARNHLAARRFDDALSVIEALREDHPKDSGILKLRSLTLQEKEKQASLERLERELKALKKLVNEKKYLDVLAQSERIQGEFPGNADLGRLLEFSRAQQAQIERELQQQKIVEEVKKLFDSARFEEAFHAALAGLKTFPDNQKLQSLREQADSQQRKLETRQHIEQRIREIKVKINRGKISEAIDLANQTLVTLGPDTDVTQLLNSARVEYDARERKKNQEAKLGAIRSLIGAGKLVDATRTLDEAVAEKTLEEFDPLVHRVCEELEAAKAAANAATITGITPPTVSLSREYAWLQGPPTSEVAPPQETRTPPDAPDAKSSTGQTFSLPAQPVVPPAAPDIPPPTSTPTVRRSGPIAEPVGTSPTLPTVPVRRNNAQQLVPQVRVPEAKPVPALNWKKPARVTAVSLGVIALIWGAVRVVPLILPHRTTPTNAIKPPLKPEPNPLEVQQREAVNTADKLVASNDFEKAVEILNQAAGLNGPLTAEIKKKQTQIEESMQNQNLRDLRRKEEQLWQQANEDVAKGRFVEAQKTLHQLLALGDGGLRRSEAQQYLTHTIPARQREDRLLTQARQASQKGDLNSLQSASDLLKQVIVQESPRKPEAEQLLQDVRARLFGIYASGARQDLQRGDFHSSRLKAGLIKENGGDAGMLISEIDQAEQNRLTQLESQFNQLKQSDDDTAAQALSNVQRGFQSIVDDPGPRSDEAKSFADKAPAAIREVHDRAANKRADAAYQQILAKYQQASNANDKSGLEAARTGFQSIAQAGGPHASEAQKFIEEIGPRLATLSQPPPPPLMPVKPEASSRAPDSEALLSLVKRYAQAFEQRDPDSLKQIWPTMGKLYAGYKISFEKASAIRMQVQTESVKISTDGSTASVSAQVTQEYTPQGQKPRTVKGRTIFQFAKTNGSWVITNIQ